MGACTSGHWIQTVLALRPVFCAAGLGSSDCVSHWTPRIATVSLFFGVLPISPWGEISSVCFSHSNGASKSWEQMHLGDIKRTECSDLHGEEAQNCTVVFHAIRFSSVSIYGVPTFVTRKSGGFKFLEHLLHPRYQDRSSMWASSFHLFPTQRGHTTVCM